MVFFSGFHSGVLCDTPHRCPVSAFWRSPPRPQPDTRLCGSMFHACCRVSNLLQLYRQAGAPCAGWSTSLKCKSIGIVLCHWVVARVYSLSAVGSVHTGSAQPSASHWNRQTHQAWSRLRMGSCVLNSRWAELVELCRCFILLFEGA